MRGEKIRKPIEYIASLNQVIALEPEMIVPSHQDPIVGKEQIKADLIKMRDAVQYVHDRTMEGMNAGKNVYQLMEEIALPPELEMTQIHGRVSWAVKSIWEYYATWFHWDTTTELYAVPRSALFPEITALAGADVLTDAGEAHIAEGRNVGRSTCSRSSRPPIRPTVARRRRPSGARESARRGDRHDQQHV